MKGIVLQWVWWFILSVGCAEWVVTLINRVHGLPVREQRLRHVRHFQEVMLIIVPWTVFLGLLIHSRELMDSLIPDDHRQASWWARQFTGDRVWITILGVSGFLGLLTSIIRYHFHHTPSRQILRQSTMTDVASQLNKNLLGNGPYRWLAKFPWNEIFQLEVTEKHYCLDTLPKEWNGLSIVHLTDVHFIGTVKQSYFEYVCELTQSLNPDMIVFTGDLLDDQRLTEWLPSTLGRLNAPLGCFYILGNHDWNLDVDAIRNEMNRIGWIDVSATTRTISHRGRDLLIGGTERPWMGDHPEFPVTKTEAFRLLLSHTPDNLTWGRRAGVDLMLSGHNHGGQVVLPLIGPVFSPSLHGVRYAGGSYEASPTLLHVSRGLSSRYPLRWRCPPELTKLVLHPARSHTDHNRDGSSGRASDLST